MFPVNPVSMEGSQWDIREQVLANVRTLWPMIEEERYLSGRTTSMRALPKNLEVVITSGGHWCKAAIVYGGEISNNTKAPHFIFAESEKFATEREALCAISKVTEHRLREMFGEHVYLAAGTKRLADEWGYGAVFT